MSVPVDDTGLRQLLTTAGNLGAVRIPTTPKQSRDSISPDLRGYLMERRRALMTELDSLNKLLGLTIK